MNQACKAIIIDDEAWIREGLSEHVGWRELGIELVRSFRDGTEAYAYLEQEPVAVVLSDIRMPNMTGLELLAKLHERRGARPDLPLPKVIFLSGYEDFKYAQEALRLGAVDYLLKPAEVEEIEAALARAKRMAEESQERNVVPGEAAGAGSDRSGTDEPGSYLIKKAIHMLTTRYGEDLLLSDIAGELFITPNYLSRLFRQETGKSFVELLSDIRLENAQALLSKETMKIYEVGAAVGYSNPRYFSEWFHKNTGMTPGEYRNLHYGTVT